MSSLSQKSQEEFRQLVWEAVKDGLKQLDDAIKRGTYIGTYFDWPSVSYSTNGMPSFSRSLFSGPKDYTDVFLGNKPPAPADTIDTFVIVFRFIQDHVEILRAIVPLERAENIDSQTQKIFTYLFIGHIIDRYTHTCESLEPEENNFDKIYQPLSRFLFEDKLPIEVYVPILFLNFDFDDFEISPGYSITRMDDFFQITRAPLRAYGPRVHESVLASATHAFVMKGLQIKPANPFDRYRLSEALSDSNIFPLPTIDNFFAALRIATGLHTGYAQALIKPLNWARTYKAYLPPLEGTSIKTYPQWFENFYWLQDNLPTLSKDESANIGNLFSKLLDIASSSIRLAIRRLNMCYVRDSDEDVMIDAAIGLEALLSDDQPQEMTHRSPTEIFREVKKLYAYRSALVHGSATAEKKKEITVLGGKKIPAPGLALEYLRLTLRVILRSPRLRILS